MEIERSKDLQADHLSNYRSHGNHHRPCSQSWNQLGRQSQKMSIGITVDGSLKPKSKQAEVHKVVAGSREMQASLGEIHVQRNNERQEVEPNSKGNIGDAERQEGSPWIARPLRRYAENEESPDIAKKNLDAPIEATHEQTTKCSSQFVVNPTVPESSNEKQKKFDGASCSKDKENNIFDRRLDKVPQAAAKKACFVEMGVLHERTNLPLNRMKEILKMNLWEALGTAASPIKQLPDSQLLESGADDMSRGQNKFEGPSNTRQCSDTTGPEYESPMKPTTRLATRSLMKKRASNKLQPQNVEKQAKAPATDSKKPRTKQLTGNTARQPKKAFSFNEKQSDMNTNAAPSRSNMKSKEKSSGVERMLPPDKGTGNPVLSENTSRRPSAEYEKDAPVTTKQTKDFGGSSKLKGKGPTVFVAAELQNQFSCLSPLRNGLECDDQRNPILKTKPAAQSPFSIPRVNLVHKHQQNQPAKGNLESLDKDTFILGSKLPGSLNISANGLQKNNSGFSSKMKYQHKAKDRLASPHNAENQIQSNGKSPHDVVGRSYNFTSPVVQKKTVIRSPSPSSLDQANETKNQNNSPGHAKADIFLSKLNNRLMRSPDTSGSATAESSDDSSEMRDFSTCTPMESPEGKNEEGCQFSSKKPQLDSFVEKAFGNKGFTEDIDMFPEVHFMEKPTTHRRKWRRLHQDKDHSEDFPSLFSPEVQVETDDMMEASQQTQEDGLARAVTLFGLALEKVKSKMILVMKRRCLDILVSAADEVHQHLQTVKSQIQIDIEKITSQSRSKGKCLETKFQGLQDQLNTIHEKFKEEIDHHLQDCRNSVEELEAEQTELRGAIERQKASHRKLLLEVEEAVQNHLTNAQNRLASVQEAIGPREDAAAETFSGRMPQRWHFHMS
ncbi:Meiosis-specific protein ASY3-like protein [Drosera capensis]